MLILSLLWGPFIQAEMFWFYQYGVLFMEEIKLCEAVVCLFLQYDALWWAKVLRIMAFFGILLCNYILKYGLWARFHRKQTTTYKSAKESPIYFLWTDIHQRMLTYITAIPSVRNTSVCADYKLKSLHLWQDILVQNVFSSVWSQVNKLWYKTYFAKFAPIICTPAVLQQQCATLSCH